MPDFIPHDERIKIELNVYEELSISVFKISRAVDSTELIVGLILASKFIDGKNIIERFQVPLRVSQSVTGVFYKVISQ